MLWFDQINRMITILRSFYCMFDEPANSLLTVSAKNYSVFPITKLFEVVLKNKVSEFF